jgi:pullulanase/glycogen debranching enzyme
LSIVALAQGVPFFHAGDDILRSKSMDRNSFNSGDWFNALDWTYQSNGWGHGLPPEGDNGDRWDIMQPLLANEDLQVDHDQVLFANAVFREWLQIRRSSPLFRLRTADDIAQRLQFHNTGEDQVPGVIVMSISDMEGENLDPNYAMIVVIFNASDEEQDFTLGGISDAAFVLHPIQQQSVDEIVRTASFSGGTFTVPARTTAVFVLPE